MSSTPEADRLAGLSDAELIQEAHDMQVNGAASGSTYVPSPEKQLHLAYGLMGSALVAAFLALAIIYSLSKARRDA